MRKKVSFIIAFVVCLALAQVGLTLWQSFASRLPYTSLGSNWLLKLYDPMVPNEAVDWATHAIAIAFVVALAVALRHYWRCGTFISFIVAGVVGAAVIPLLMGIVHTAAFEDYLYHETYMEALQFLLFNVLMSQRVMIAHTITAAFAAMFGIAFDRHLIMNAPVGPSVLGVIATRVLAIVRRLRKRDPEAMLETSEA